MVFLKRFLLLLALITVPVLLMSQEMTIEQSYLQQSIEHMIIREMSRGNNESMKEVALEYIGNAIDRGNLSDEVRTALEFLSTEGSLYITRENGRITNDFPRIRSRAAAYLGNFQTVESKDALIRIMRNEERPEVLTEAIKSLSLVGIDEGGETVNRIIWEVDRFDRNNPNNLLVISAIEAFETFADINGYINPEALALLRRVMVGGGYTYNVRERARQSLDILIRLPPRND